MRRHARVRHWSRLDLADRTEGFGPTDLGCAGPLISESRVTRSLSSLRERNCARHGARICTIRWPHPGLRSETRRAFGGEIAEQQAEAEQQHQAGGAEFNAAHDERTAALA